jgi:hypothetical protein
MSLPERSILQLTGQDGTAEFDVDPDQEVFRMTVGKEQRRFKRVDLWSMVFAIANAEQQADMIPVKRSEVVTYRRKHNVKLKKDMRKGDVVHVSCEINVEKSVVEGLKGMIEQQASKVVDRGGLPIIGASKLSTG